MPGLTGFGLGFKFDLRTEDSVRFEETKMIKITNALRAQFAQAEKLLLNTGWTKSHSVCHDGGATGNFGICFIKNGTPIYLNYKTVGTILEIIEA
jgi:hypothetical protein